MRDATKSCSLSLAGHKPRISPVFNNLVTQVHCVWSAHKNNQACGIAVQKLGSSTLIASTTRFVQHIHFTDMFHCAPILFLATHTVECCYVVQCCTIFHTSLRWHREHKSEYKFIKDTHTSASWASYGISIVRIWEKIDHVITVPHRIYHRFILHWTLCIQYCIAIIVM